MNRMAVDQDVFGHTSGGLERGELNVYTSVDTKDQSEHSGASPIANARRLSKKLRSVFHHGPDEATFASTDQGKSDPRLTVVPALAPTPPNTSEKDRFSDALPEKPNLPPLKDFVKSPMQTAKSIMHSQGGNDLAENLAQTDATHEASVQVVRAYDKLIETTTDSDEEVALQELELLKKARQDAYVRWTLDRHITKVGRVQAHRVPIRYKKDFLVIDKSGKEVMQWKDYGSNIFHSHLEQYGGTYIGISSDLPNAKNKALMAGCERLLLTSAPLQDLFLRLRNIAHWEDPLVSVACLIAYATLLYYDYVVRALLLLAMSLVVKQRYYPRTIEDLRENLERSENRDATPTDLSQHIDQHGGHGWVEPLIDKAGPTVISHIEDAADFLEILRNFYEWRDPRRTASTLCVFVMLWVVLTVTPLWLLFKGSFVAAGITFFGLMPLAHRYPKYRLLMSPMIWTFWKIPTHAEWAIARLQAEGTQQLQKIRNREPSSSSKENSEDTEPPSVLYPTNSADQVTPSEKAAARAPPLQIGRHRCIHEKRHGKLCLSTDQVSFETSPSSNEKWRLRYEHMDGMQKVPGGSSMKQGDDLIFTDVDGRAFHVSGLTKRDEIFSQIIGYSSVRWQRTG